MFFRGTGERYSEGADPERCGAVVDRVVTWLSDPAAEIPFEEMEELLDLERVRWFTALTELSGDLHGMADFNMKGYCDPVAQKAEFLIWDTRFGDWTALADSAFSECGTQLLRVDRFRDLHDAALYELAVERIEPMLARWDEFHAEHAELVADDRLYWFPRGGPDGGLMRDRSENLKRRLRANAAEIRAALGGDELRFHVDHAAHELTLSTEDRGAKTVTALLIEERDGIRELPLDPPVSVHGRFRARRPIVHVPLPRSLTADAVVGVVALNAHTGAPVDAVASQDPLPGDAVRPPRPVRPPLPDLPAGFVADHVRGEIAVGPGRVALEGALRIPRGWKVEVAPGTTLAAGPAALLEIRGDLVARGTADAPVRFHAAGSEDWGALAVAGRPAELARVELAHVEIQGGSGSNAGHARYTASLAIYFADVRLDHVKIANGRAEDAINLKNCTFEAQDCVYLDGAGDAVDYDFSTGVDLRTRVENFPDDGIDISGSRVRIEGAELIAIGDKALSLGERSAPEIVDVSVSDARIGCVVKDETAAVIQGLVVIHSRTAIAMYRKKEAYAPPTALFSGLVVANVDAFAIVGHGSELSFEDSLRFVDADTPIFHFPGLETHITADLHAFDREALFTLAVEARASSGPVVELR
jgi:hypothetical protein